MIKGARHAAGNHRGDDFCGMRVVGLPLLAIAGLPNTAAWPWAVASVVVHILYFGLPDRDLSLRRS